MDAFNGLPILLRCCWYGNNGIYVRTYLKPTVNFHRTGLIIVDHFHLKLNYLCYDGAIHKRHLQNKGGGGLNGFSDDITVTIRQRGERVRKWPKSRRRH